jgi:hypothetical protein
MNRFCLCALVVASAQAGCSTGSNEVRATQLSRYDCAQIAAEQRRMYTRASDLASLGDTGAPEAEYARLREEFEALREAAIRKKCQGSKPPLQQAASPDASAAQGSTSPRIAPPEAPLE